LTWSAHDDEPPAREPSEDQVVPDDIDAVLADDADAPQAIAGAVLHAVEEVGGVAAPQLTQPAKQRAAGDAGSSSAGAVPSRIGGSNDPKWRPPKRKRGESAELASLHVTLQHVSSVLTQMQEDAAADRAKAAQAATRAAKVARRARRHEFNLMRMLLQQPLEPDTESDVEGN